MCFGGSSTPQAPVSTPAAPVDAITAGDPTVTVAGAPTPTPVAPRTDSSPAVQGQASSGVSNLGM